MEIAFALIPSEHRPVDLRIGNQIACMKVREVIKLVEADGWRIVRTRGSHRHYHHPSKVGIVTIAGHPSEDLDPGTRAAILKQAGLKK